MRWETLFEELLRGLVHTINNRITALSAFAELAAMDNELPETDMLRQEIRRLNGVSAMVGMLASRNEEREALELSGVLDAAVGVHEHHPRSRTITCRVEKSGMLLPVRVPRWALLRMLILMVDEAKRAADAAGMTSTTIEVVGDEATLKVHGAAVEPPGVDALHYAMLCGGELLPDDRGQVLVLPSLLELRRRERKQSDSQAV